MNASEVSEFTEVFESDMTEAPDEKSVEVLRATEAVTASASSPGMLTSMCVVAEGDQVSKS